MIQTRRKLNVITPPDRDVTIIRLVEYTWTTDKRFPSEDEITSRILTNDGWREFKSGESINLEDLPHITGSQMINHNVEDIANILEARLKLLMETP